MPCQNLYCFTLTDIQVYFILEHMFRFVNIRKKDTLSLGCLLMPGISEWRI